MFETIGLLQLKILYNAALSAMAGVLVYAGIDQKAYTVLVVLLVVDYTTGIIKAYALEESITSNKMKYGAASKVVLPIVPLVLGYAAQGLNQEVDGILIYGISVLILSETYSILGNINAIRTGEELPEIDAVAKIAKWIAGILKKMDGKGPG